MGNANAKPHPKPRNKKQVRWRAAERPSAPGKPSLVQENGLVPDIIHISWQKPEKDGGSPISLYIVEHRRVGSSHWMKSSIHPVTTNELTVNGLEPGWRYQFRIRAENAVGLSDCSEISDPFTVILHRSVITAPKFTQELKDATVIEDSKVEYEVHFLGQPLPNICWFKDGFEIFSSNRIRIITVSDRSVLTFLQTTTSDEGEIKCTATNKAGHSSTKCKLTVEAPPTIRLPKSYQYQDGIIFEIGETVLLNVFVGGRPTPLVFWSHDGESIQNDDRHEIEYVDKTATLKIENAIRSDRGEYQIKAVNKLSQEQESFLVTITDKPTPPGKAKVLLTSGRSVTLSWSTPDDDGGCKIGNYIIEYYRLGWNVWLKAATSRQVTTMLGDLIEGSQYKFRVKAESPYGVSDPSEESETVFIPDSKRGINSPHDITKNKNQPYLSLEFDRTRRANSSPRVSFSLMEDMPVRPERRKLAKTPEASPRMKRKLSSPVINRQSGIQIIDGTPISSRNILSLSVSQKKDEKLSPIISQKIDSCNIFWESPTSPSLPQKLPKFSSNPSNSTQGISSVKEKAKSSSPEILITLADNENEKNVSTPPKLSPAQRRRSFGDNISFENRSDFNAGVKTVEITSEDTRTVEKIENRIRPPLTRQEFSGSSEFMLVLCPEGEQGAQLRNLGIDFEGDSIPPPLSLSAPELGMEPPQEPLLRRSASSSELLTFRLMERLREDVFGEKENFEVERNEINNKRELNIPMIQLNSKPTNDFAGFESKPSKNRRLSVEIVSKRHQNWPQRRYSLKNSNDINTKKLEKFTETEETKKEVLEYRQTEMRSQKHQNFNSNSGDDWMKDYEESIPSEEETDFSSNEELNTNITHQASYEAEDVEDTYNPRNRTLKSSIVSSDDPFEILTVRKEPPNSSIIPRPILKKKNDNNTFDARSSPTLSDLKIIRERSNSFTEYSRPFIPTEIKNQRTQRHQSPTFEDVAVVDGTGNYPYARRSSSLLPNENGIFGETSKKSKNKNKSVTNTEMEESGNISALANSASITGAGVIIPDEMINNNETAEESKVVVDFYGDIVKSYGGKPKPVAEFSTAVGTKYDNFEERKLSEFKPDVNKIVQSKISQKSSTPPNESVRLNENPLHPESQSSAFSSSHLKRHNDQISKKNEENDFRNEKSEPTDNREFKFERKTMSPSRKMRIPQADDVSPYRKQFYGKRRTEKSKSRSNSSVAKTAPRSRDASTSPVRFEYWENDLSSRHSLERDYFRTISVTSSRSSSLNRRSLSPARPMLKAMTTQTSFRIEPQMPADVLTKQVELAKKAEKRVKGMFEYFTDLAMMSVACWFYLFQNEYLAIPVLVILVYRQLSEKVVKFRQGIKKYLPSWIKRKFGWNDDAVQQR